MEKMVISLANQPELQASAETLWVERLPGGTFRIRNIPALAYDLDLDDEVEAVEGEDGRLEFRKVSSRSGNVAYRLMLLESSDAHDPRLADALVGVKALSSAFEKANERFFIYNIAPDIDRKTLLSLLDSGEREGFWNYESSSDDPYV